MYKKHLIARYLTGVPHCYLILVAICMVAKCLQISFISSPCYDPEIYLEGGQGNRLALGFIF